MLYEKLASFANKINEIPPKELKLNNPIYNETKKIIELITDETVEQNDSIKILYIYFLSFMYYNDKKISHAVSMLKIILKSSISHYTKLFYYWQLQRFKFLNPEFTTDNEFPVLLENLYSDIYCSFKNELNLTENHISANERNINLIFIITSQFLSLEHAPTKTTLDRAYTLCKYWGKQVLIINTADLVTFVNCVPFYNLFGANIFNKYSEISELNYNECSFQFYQPKEPMPNKDSMMEIINCVLRYKPYFILNIGGNNITSDLCSLFVPTVSQATVFSDIPQTLGTFAITANPKLQTKDNILSTTFTFSYKPQTHTYTRSDFSLPDNKFIIIMVGGRLTEEVSYEFLRELSEIFKYNIHITFVGNFSTYESIIEKDSVLRENTSFIGFQDDILAIVELVDLYVNPPRTGGGSSIAEALSKGKPAVTLDFGDCSFSAGKDFCVKNIDEMKNSIIKYATDSEFYNIMSKKALERNEILTNTKKALENIVSSAENSKYWW